MAISVMGMNLYFRVILSSCTQTLGKKIKNGGRPIRVVSAVWILQGKEVKFYSFVRQEERVYDDQPRWWEQTTKEEVSKDAAAAMPVVKKIKKTNTPKRR